MSNADHEYRFVVDGFVPSTLPMARLAEYMSDLAQLLGETDHVHFERLDSGSVELVHRIDSGAEPRIRRRIRDVEGEGALPEVARAFQSLNRRLTDDGASGTLRDSEGSAVINFPGQVVQQGVVWGPVEEVRDLDGVLIRIGGQGDPVPVHLQDAEEIHQCLATRELAQRLARHLYRDTLRVTGAGRWKRLADGSWSVLRFKINEFVVLDDTPLSEVVASLRAAEGTEWSFVENAHEVLRQLRDSEDTD